MKIRFLVISVPNPRDQYIKGKRKCWRLGITIMTLRQKRRESVEDSSQVGLAGDDIIPVASTTCLMKLSGHPWRSAG